ncbi:MAG: VOC family protein [Chloracidobacterium sp.]|nr:VOC family protein [Chloracidobacterium sp.]
MQKITTFLMFSDRAVEAMEFYVSIFKNSRILGLTNGPNGQPMGGTFELEGQPFVAYNGGPHFTFSEGVSQLISCETQEEIDHYYDLLSDGGEQQPCGWVKDKFGLSWQVVPPVLLELLSDADRAAAGRVAESMLKMRKIIIDDLLQAAAG